jgi:hypothetical protein
VVASVAIEVTLPEALDTEIVQAIIASERRGIVTTLFTSLLRLYDVPVGNIHQHRFVLQTIATPMHVLETLEAEVVFAIGAKHLWTLDGTRRAKAATCSRERGVVFSRTLTAFV